MKHNYLPYEACRFSQCYSPLPFRNTPETRYGELSCFCQRIAALYVLVPVPVDGMCYRLCYEVYKPLGWKILADVRFSRCVAVARHGEALQREAAPMQSVWNSLRRPRSGTTCIPSVEPFSAPESPRFQIREHDCSSALPRASSTGCNRSSAASPDADRGSVPAVAGPSFTLVEKTLNPQPPPAIFGHFFPQRQAGLLNSAPTGLFPLSLPPPFAMHNAPPPCKISF